jgi:hypothetical protein
MDLTPKSIYDTVVNKGPLDSARVAQYILTAPNEILDFIRCKLMAADVNMDALVFIYSLLVKNSQAPLSIPILWHHAFKRILCTLKCVPEDDLSYEAVREQIFYHGYLFIGPDLIDTLRHSLTMLSSNPMSSPLWCMITQAIMECAPPDNKCDLCIESLDNSCSKEDFIKHVLKSARTPSQ